jgi:hypothetical protein
MARTLFSTACHFTYDLARGLTAAGGSLSGLTVNHRIRRSLHAEEASTLQALDRPIRFVWRVVR